MGVRSPHEYLFGDRVYKIVKAKNGKGDLYGVIYVEKKLVGKKVTLNEIKKDDKQFLEVVKREYTFKKEMKGGKKR